MPRKATGAATGSNPNKALTSAQAKANAARGAGRPKGSTNKITTVSQLHALHKELGAPFEEIVAKTAGKLYRDFQNDKNVREWTDMCKHLSNKLSQEIPKEILIENPYQQMTAEDIQARLQELTNKLHGE